MLPEQKRCLESHITASEYAGVTEHGVILIGTLTSLEIPKKFSFYCFVLYWDELHVLTGSMAESMAGSITVASQSQDII